jgi:large subunit ribosomal protein L19
MGRDPLIEELEKEQLKKEIVEFDIGDTVKVSSKIIEGEKERIQAFQGTVIARSGRGAAETFSLHRLSYGEGMERVFHLHSPRITKIEVIKKGDIRRAKLYYLRGTEGKAAKVKERIGGKRKSNSMNDNRATEPTMIANELRESSEAATTVSET